MKLGSDNQFRKVWCDIINIIVTKFVFILFFIIIPITSIKSIEPLEFDELLFVHIQNISQADYVNFIKENKPIQISDEWQTCVDSVFRKLIQNSSNPLFKPIYSVINKPTLNAFAFPGGQFILHKGLFDNLDAEIKSQEGTKNSSGLRQMRENYLAPILAHELAHYFNQHTFKAFKKIVNNSSKSSKRNLDMIRFDQELELDADFSGLLMMQKSGYPTEYMIKVLEMNNAEYQSYLNKGEKINPYYQTHPSPNERLSRINSGKQELYTLLSKLEKAYADIQMNQNLQNARDILQEALTLYPDNIEFLKSDAIALHKIWLEAVPLSLQKVKSLIELPSFRDAMISDPSRTKAISKKIPELAKYRKAIAAYRKLGEISDPWLLSNFSTLLAYSPDSEDEKNAILMAKKSFKLQRNIQTINNLAVVYFLCNEVNLSVDILSTMTIYLHPELKSIVDPIANSKGKNFAEEWKSEIEKSKIKIKDLDEDTGAIVLNLALVNEKLSKKLAATYFDEYDDNSVWAKYLENISDIKIPKIKHESGMVTIESLGPGSTMKDLLEKWKKPQKNPSLEDGMEAWYYYEKSARVYLHHGKIIEIFLFDESSPMLSNKVKIGSTRKEIDKVLGKSQKKASRRIYKKDIKIAISFDEDEIAEQIYLIQD